MHPQIMLAKPNVLLTISGVYIIYWLFKRFRRWHRPHAVRIFITVGGRKFYSKMQVRDDKVLVVSITGEDAKGNPAPLASGAAPAWSVDNPALANLTPSTDGLSCNVVPTGTLGSFNVQVSIPAVGSEPAMQGSLPVEVIAGDAVQIALSGVQQ